VKETVSSKYMFFNCGVTVQINLGVSHTVSCIPHTSIHMYNN